MSPRTRPAVDPANRTVIDEHLRYERRRNRSKITCESRRGVLERLAAFLFPVLLIDASSSDLDRWQDQLTVSASGVATYSVHVRAFYSWATASNRRADDPSLSLPLPHIRTRMPRPIPENDLRVALAAAVGVLRVWMLLAAYCGLRAGEIAAIRSEDIRRDSDSGAMLLVHGKGDVERVVRVPAPILAELNALDLPVRGPVFRSPTGEQTERNALTKATSRHFRTLGMPYTLHQLRHRFATTLADRGADIRDISSALGHRTLSTTTLYLAHNARRGASAVDALSAEIVEVS